MFFNKKYKDKISELESDNNGLLQKVSALKNLVAAMDERLEVDPGGGDKIDELEEAINNFRFANKTANSKIKELELQLSSYKEAMIGFKDMMEKSIRALNVIGLGDMHLVMYHNVIKKVNDLVSK